MEWNSRHTNTRIYYHACFLMRESSNIAFTSRYWGLRKLGYTHMHARFVDLPKAKISLDSNSRAYSLMLVLTVWDWQSVRGFWSASAVLDYLLFLILWRTKIILPWIEQREMDSWLLVLHFTVSVRLNSRCSGFHDGHYLSQRNGGILR